MDGEVVKVVSTRNTHPSPGSAGIKSQLPGGCTSISSVSAATGGIGGKLVQSDVK